MLFACVLQPRSQGFSLEGGIWKRVLCVFPKLIRAYACSQINILFSIILNSYCECYPKQHSSHSTCYVWQTFVGRKACQAYKERLRGRRNIQFGRLVRSKKLKTTKSKIIITKQEVISMVLY